MADARDSKSRDRKVMRVRLPPPAQVKSDALNNASLLFYTLYSSNGSGNIIFNPFLGIASFTFFLVSLLNALLK